MKQNSITAVLFDLDGTIIDSYPGLQEAFNYAYDQVYNYECTYNIRPLVGPPMGLIFKQLTREENESIVADFVQTFQQKYDADSYRQCELYAGIVKLLQHLHKEGVQLFIATNKRLAPTLLILEHLSIDKYFTNIYCIDSVHPSYPNKTAMVKDILLKEGLQADHTIFVGDTHHDQQGAVENGLKFIYAGYGFGELKNLEYTIQHSSEIINYI